MNTSLLYTQILNLSDSEKTKLLDFLGSLLKSGKNKKKIHPKAGCMKGTFIMKDNFDEPLEDFKEYME
ncbi:MAG: hypothetical protein JWO06_1165 [Bacteroidota bacterium]|nr:hypothetical protein [Bacteroidota bacterium]